MSEHRMTIPALRDPYHGIIHWITDPGHGWLAVPAEAVRSSGASISSHSYLSPDGAWANQEEYADAPANHAQQLHDDPVQPWPEHHTDGESYVRELSPWQ